mmetsp:Transcript_16721/g.25127  ORF Transcript_16721/g.25127 Transcript_16721/m.25127 type:complete len:479 (+) Transcript_16721:104-1540(+)|eukprot:CAMPEP_0197290336 /NCGR_PEP_ID=MMETSP0890-20130614/7557_1 /TAXON_ID=44058 ORGANISM="Aureoumbra lagunensis, Strain CCMP1510" /NCGR_SAMPLE_ID=MMETSP0890 /ASSEMBLY_ACC=CAM_ASM_000533 /LENGTH=478 /DNA_ID=CAMNT_0042762279 /DNA_START=29 /DNA_END=1465 /DNA_ORIENTATION=+
MASPLPPGWTESRDAQGRVYYSDHINHKTQWERPAGHTSVAPPIAQPAPPPPIVQPKSSSLPPGWEERTTPDGRKYYVNHNDKSTHWTLPANLSSQNQAHTSVQTQNNNPVVVVAQAAPPRPPQGPLVVQSWSAGGIQPNSISPPAPPIVVPATPYGNNNFTQNAQPPIMASGKRKALLIGINYKGTRAELRGCINDVHRMRQYLLTQSFPPQETIILTDDNAQMMPSRANILRYIDWLVSGTQRGDSLFFHFSGHGAQQEDLDGDEEDGYDETIVPCDFKRAGQITDDELWKRLVAPLPEGSRLTSIMDCCHSGTGLDLAFTYTQSRGWTVDDNPAHAAADIQMLSGCEDAQCSADAATSSGIHGGAMTSAFLQVIKDNPMPLYPDLMSALHRELRRKGFNQRPQLSSSQRFDLNDRVFSLTDGFIPNSNSTLGRIIHPQQGRRRRRRRKRRPGALGGFNAMFAAGAGGLLLGSMLS